MPRPTRDLTGWRFNHLAVDGPAPKDRFGNTRWACTCRRCGRTGLVRHAFALPRAVSCGCFSRRHDRSPTPLPGILPPNPTQKVTQTD